MSHKYHCFQSHYKPRVGGWGGGGGGDGGGGRWGEGLGRVVSNKY